jgi:hypothetical protein
MPKNNRNRDLMLSAKVKNMAALGMDHALIAKRIGLTLAQLEAAYSRELETGPLELDAFVGAGLFQNAVSGIVGAQIFWLKSRAGWCETVRREISGPQGAPIAIKVANTSVHVTLPCNQHNECPRMTPERSIKILEKILKDLQSRNALPSGRDEKPSKD